MSMELQYGALKSSGEVFHELNRRRFHILMGFKISYGGGRREGGSSTKTTSRKDKKEHVIIKFANFNNWKPLIHSPISLLI